MTTLERLTARAEEWNKLYSVGTTVMSYKLINPLAEGNETKTRSLAWVMGDHSVVVKVYGVTGVVVLESVQPIEIIGTNNIANSGNVIRRPCTCPI